MDQERDTSSPAKTEQELHRDLERTRQSISETLNEIKGEVSQALDGQTCLRRYPEAFLIAALGLLIARDITGSSGRSRNKALNGDPDRSPKSEGSTIRRVVDMTSSALLAQVIPISSSKLRELLGRNQRGAGKGFAKGSCC